MAEAAYAIGEPELVAYAEINLAVDYLMLGDPERAWRYLEKVQRAAERPGKRGDERMEWHNSRYLFDSAHPVQASRTRLSHPDK